MKCFIEEGDGPDSARGIRAMVQGDALMSTIAICERLDKLIELSEKQGEPSPCPVPSSPFQPHRHGAPGEGKNVNW